MSEYDDLPTGVQDCVDLLRDRDFEVQFLDSLGGTRVVADRCEVQIDIAQVYDVWRLTIRDAARDERVQVDGHHVRIHGELRLWLGINDVED